MDTKNAPSTKFEAETKMGDAIAKNPRIQWVLRQFHIGGCSHCGFDMNDTVKKVAEDHGVPLETLLTAINSAT
jgi:hypothetical protein